MITANDPASYAAIITAAWTTSVDSILEAAAMCAEADARLSADEKSELLAALPFAAPTFSKLVQIGNDPRLYRPEVRKLLPPSYSIIYAAHQLNEARLTHALAEGVLHPEAKRAEVEACRSAPDRALPARLPVFDDVRNEAPLPKAKEVEICFGELLIPHDFPVEARERLEKEMLRIAKLFGIEFVRRLTPDERLEVRNDRAMNAFAKRWVKIARQLTRQRVKEQKQARTRSNKKWGFAWDETHLDNNSGWDKIEQVLSIVGIEDELDDIRSQAEQMANAPEIEPPAGYEEAGLPEPRPALNGVTADTFDDWK